MSRANPIAVSKTLTCSTHSRALAPECPESGRAQRREAFIVGVHYSHRPRLSLSAMVGYHATFDDDTKKNIRLAETREIKGSGNDETEGNIHVHLKPESYLSHYEFKNIRGSMALE